MKFALVVNCPPSSVNSFSAYLFARAVLDGGHQLHRVFFYQEGVFNGNSLSSPPQDELNMPALWQSLNQSSDVDLCVCIAAAIRRGVLDEGEAARYAKAHYNLLGDFTIAGLGQLIEATQTADRVVTFG